MPVYKVSFVILGGNQPGTIVNLSRSPQVGEKVKLGEGFYRVEEVVDLLPPRGDFHYVHVTCRPVNSGPLGPTK
jgi:hypothetical protein